MSGDIQTTHPAFVAFVSALKPQDELRNFIDPFESEADCPSSGVCTPCGGWHVQLPLLNLPETLRNLQF